MFVGLFGTVIYNGLPKFLYNIPCLPYKTHFRIWFSNQTNPTKIKAYPIRFQLPTTDSHDKQTMQHIV